MRCSPGSEEGVLEFPGILQSYLDKIILFYRSQATYGIQFEIYTIQCWDSHISSDVSNMHAV